MPTPTQPGLVVLDTNCFKELTEQATIERLRASLHAVDLRAGPSAMNVLQLAVSPSSGPRARRIEAVRQLADGRPLLPWPYELLRVNAKALLEGRDAFILPPSGLEDLLDSPPEPGAALVVAAAKQLKKMDAALEKLHETYRPMLRAVSREMEPGEWLHSAQAFLAEQWSQPERLAIVTRMLWRLLDLPGEPPLDQLHSPGAWRIVVDSFGVVFFRRMVKQNLESVVGLTDMLQLSYLGGRDRGIMVTADKAFHQAATAVVQGRLQNMRVMLWREFAASNYLSVTGESR